MALPEPGAVPPGVDFVGKGDTKLTTKGFKKQKLKKGLGKGTPLNKLPGYPKGFPKKSMVKGYPKGKLGKLNKYGKYPILSSKYQRKRFPKPYGMKHKIMKLLMLKKLKYPVHYGGYPKYSINRKLGYGKYGGYPKYTFSKLILIFMYRHYCIL